MLSPNDRVALILGRAIIRAEALEAERELLLAKIRELEEAQPDEVIDDR